MLKRILKSILLRYIFAYGIVMVILIAGISFYVNSVIRSGVMKNIEDANINRLGVLRVYHEEKLAALLDVSNQLGLLPSISPFRFSESPMEAFHLMQNLTAFKTVGNIGQQMFVIFDRDSYLYSTTTSVSLDMFTGEMMIIDNISAESLTSLIRNKDGIPVLTSAKGTQSFFTQNSDVVILSVPLRMNGRTRIGTVVFLISNNAYQKMFADSVYEPRNMYIVNNGEILSAARRIDSIDDETVLKALNDPVQSTRIITIGDTRYLMCTQEGDLLGLQYVSIISEEAIHTETSRSLFMFGSVLMVVFLLCFILMVNFSRIFVKPIHEIRNVFSGVNETDTAKQTLAGDHFDVIRRGIEKLAEQNTMLHRRLDDSYTAYVADFVKNFVKINYRAKDEMIAAAGIINVNAGREYYAISLVSISGDEELRLSCHKLLEHVAIDYSEISMISMEMVSQNQYLLLIFADSLEELEFWIAATHASLLEIDADTVMSMSNIHTDFLEAGTAYFEASASFDNRFVMGTDELLRFADVSMDVTGMDEFASGFMDSFNSAFLSGDISAVHARINELVLVFGKRQFSLFTFRIIYNDIISTLLNRYLNGGNEKDRLKFYDVFQLSNCRRISDIAAILRDTCEEIIARRETSTSPEFDAILKISDYLRENFADPNLSIGMVAEEFGISAASLSQEYRKVSGMHPSDHLAWLRMEKARELLRETDMPVNAVSTAVGYYDVTSFIRRFKKEVSMTPAQYRKFVFESKA